MAPAPCSDSLMKAVEAELAADVAHAVAAALDLGELKEDALSDCLSLSRVAHHHTRHFRLPKPSSRGVVKPVPEPDTLIHH